ncbi:MAG TPA: hypothetical protein VJ276_03155 [Thermoanaerobaculia bacterium]|nr:hypothetical protein [Thermoanaerobaculia bacterium]
MDAALASVYDHHAETGHGFRFWVCLFRLEITCPRCGEVLYEGPEYKEDPIPAYQLWKAPKKRPRPKTERNH